MIKIISGIFAFMLIMSLVIMTLFTLDNFISLNTKDITATQHTYRMYDNYIDLILHKNPTKSVTLLIGENGDYEGLPNNKRLAISKFNRWLMTCKDRPDLFTFKGYMKSVN